ncbi:MAG: NADH-quinone oxidoreductase subunit M [Chitinophagaceae bacterium]|nr:MAG: NADH-quinone oxidoreductase subunit M [Chitinophagaceae bacterium]
MTFPELLLWLPLLAGIACFFFKGKSAKNWAILASMLVLAVSVASLFYTSPEYASYNKVNYYWMKQIGNSFFVGLDSTGRLLTLLTAIAFPVIFISTQKNNYKNPAAFYGLMLLSQAGLMGVFVAMDALLFYFFWELALIPVYFLCSRWGAEKRIQATFKFFVYTFAGSLLMLVGILYVYMHTPERTFEDGTMSAHSFALQSFMNTGLSFENQDWVFWLFFVAFAIKMPVFPFHTWQPDTYDQSPTSVTMVLSGLMVKMGLFGVMRWLIPIVPGASLHYANIVIIICIVGILYASCMAMVQDNIKKLIAYSSIAHIGLMCAALFTFNELSVQGAVIQMFSHGINIIGMWIVVDVLERQTGIKQISQMGGVAQKAPVLTIFLVIIALANIALPLTNAFVGEFMMFGGLFQANPWYAVASGISIILAAVYTLRMIQRVFYGELVPATAGIKDISFGERTALFGLVVFIFLFGVMPQPMIEFTKEALKNILAVGVK